MRRLAAETGRPGHVRVRAARRRARRLAAPPRPSRARRPTDGVPLRPQVTGRPIGLLLGLQTFHPLNSRPTYAALATLPLDERVARLREPEVRDRDPRRGARGRRCPPTSAMGFDRIFELGDPPEYEPPREASVAARAASLGVEPDRAVLRPAARPRRPRAAAAPAARATATSRSSRCARCCSHPSSVLGIGDGGAHVRAICDASNPTFMLTHWVRDRARGPRIPHRDGGAQADRRTTPTSTASPTGGASHPGSRPTSTSSTWTGSRCTRRSSCHDLPGGAGAPGAERRRATGPPSCTARSPGATASTPAPAPARLVRSVDA